LGLTSLASPGQRCCHRLFPVTFIVHFCFIVQAFKRKSTTFFSTYTNPHKADEKDSFHNPIFALDKKIAVWLALLYGLKKESMKKKIETLAQES